LTKGIVYFWATFSHEDGSIIEAAGDRQTLVASELMKGPVYAVLDKASPRLREAFRKGQPNIFLPFDRQGIDPFVQRFPVTLRYEGTVRGVGGLLTDEEGATTVAGLYAAGDTASREELVGATSGGGGPNAAWAIATGVWSGRSASRFARALGRSRADRPLQAIGAAGLRPTGRPHDDVSPHDLSMSVQKEILPLDRSFFRSAQRLKHSAEKLDAAWRAARSHLVGSGAAAARAREAAAMLATARWINGSALARGESRGMHRRLDSPETNVAFQHRLHVGGLDDLWVRLDRGETMMLAS
jgi:succinate dehydrogenase/fumarate reductase flavoprotein subunit